MIATLLVACGGSGSKSSGSKINDVAPNQSGAQKPILEDFNVIDVKEGDGTLALKNSKVAVHYSGWLYDGDAENNKGKLFDTSHDLGEPFVFMLGEKRVIKGWENGIPGMKVGGKRTLLIPSDMAYGDKQMGTARTTIFANSALVFDVELMGVELVELIGAELIDVK